MVDLFAFGDNSYISIFIQCTNSLIVIAFSVNEKKKKQIDEKKNAENAAVLRFNYKPIIVFQMKKKTTILCLY